jgi:hypothetical protein
MVVFFLMSVVKTLLLVFMVFKERLRLLCKTLARQYNGFAERRLTKYLEDREKIALPPKILAAAIAYNFVFMVLDMSRLLIHRHFAHVN